MKFDIEKFERREFAVNCKTEKAAINFLRLCNQRGIKWVSGDSLLDKHLWNRHREQTCYLIYKGQRMAIASISYFVGREIAIVVYDQPVSIDEIMLKGILQER